uniref:Ribosomal RNA-processing protein 43 n=1 Tax=Meloidogyne enterolobii TaxID=390850 RepID=A0A6V7XNE8_MELEN|nr:unnamed protein product [Meloidogyne enterolobii]
MSENSELLKRLDPFDYFKKFLVEGIYPEGRTINSFRDSLIECRGNVSDYQSSVNVQQGGTYISCNVKLSLGPDSDDSVFKWEIEAMESVPKDLLEHSKAHLRVLLGSDSCLISPEQLIVFTQNEGKNTKKFQLRWTLHLKIMVLSWDGFLLDAILTAIQASLLNTRLPTFIEYKTSILSETLFAEDDDFLLGEEVPLEFNIEKVRIVKPESENKPLKLEKILAYLPFLLCTFENQEKKQRFLLCDPPADLCKLYNNDFCEIIIGPNGNINLLSMCCSPSFSKSYPNDIDGELLNEIINIAIKRHLFVNNALNKCIL